MPVVFPDALRIELHCSSIMAVAAPASSLDIRRMSPPPNASSHALTMVHARWLNQTIAPTRIESGWTWPYPPSPFLSRGAEEALPQQCPAN